MEHGPFWLTFTEAARATSVSRDTIKRYHRAGRFPNATRDDSAPGGAWRVPVRDLVDAGLNPVVSAGTTPVVSGRRTTNDLPEPSVEPVPASCGCGAAGSVRLLEARLDGVEQALTEARAVAEARVDHIRDLRSLLQLTKRMEN